MAQIAILLFFFFSPTQTAPINFDILYKNRPTTFQLCALKYNVFSPLLSLAYVPNFFLLVYKTLFKIDRSGLASFYLLRDLRFCGRLGFFVCMLSSLKKKKSVPPPPTSTFKIHLPHRSWSNFPFKEDSFKLP